MLARSTLSPQVVNGGVDGLARGVGNWLGRATSVNEVSFNLASKTQTGMIDAKIRPSVEAMRIASVGINESKLTKGQARKLSALRKSVGDELGEEVFAKWMAQQAKAAAAPKPDPVAVKIEEALVDYANDKSFRLGNYGYTIKRTRGKGVSGFAVTKNEKPRK